MFFDFFPIRNFVHSVLDERGIQGNGQSNGNVVKVRMFLRSPLLFFSRSDASITSITHSILP
jgi:hypothetical protein